jgi:hypothetical protein
MPENPAAPSAVGATNARGGGPPPADVAVTSTLGPGDIGGVGGDYLNSSSLKSAIGSDTGVWHLDLRNASPTRTVYLNLGASGLTGNHKVFMYIGCNFSFWNPPDGWNLLEIPLSTPTTCPLAVQFEKDRKRYLLRLNSNQDSDTDNVSVTRFVGSEETWQIQPTGDGSAGLYLQGKGNAGLSRLGVYNMSFAITLTRD